MKKISLSLYGLFLATTLFAQAGCTDPQATNYDENALVNDGSCNYAITNYTPQFKTNLSEKLEEISAGIEFNDRYFGLADSGNPSNLYEFNPITGDILNTISLNGVENVDWESMTSDDTYIYIGDTGNNKNGNRQNLVIYKFPKSDLAADEIPFNHIEKLFYHYEDQTDFGNQPKFAIRYDCEAIVAFKDSIYLFTKDWNQLITKCYVIPKTPSGDFAALLKDSLNVKGLVTDAATIGDSLVVLVGSKLTGNHFLELLFDFQNTNFFAGNTRQILMNHDQMAQPEAILLKNDLSGFIGSERRNDINQSLLGFSIAHWIQNPEVGLLDIYNKGNQLSVFPNPIKSGSLTIEIPTELKDKNLSLYWFDAEGKQLGRQEIIQANVASFQVPSDARSGVHYILMQGNGRELVGKIVVRD